jgi:hypothetical protein
MAAAVAVAEGSVLDQLVAAGVGEGSGVTKPLGVASGVRAGVVPELPDGAAVAHEASNAAPRLAARSPASSVVAGPA